MDETTTEATVDTGATIQGVQVDDQGQAVALPEETETAEAVQDTVEAQESTSSGAEEALPEVDDKLKSFAKGIGIENVTELSEREMKLLKVAKDNQAEFQRSRQESSQLKKTMEGVADQVAEQESAVTGQNPEDAKLIKRLVVRDSLRDFWEANPGAKQFEGELAQVVTERPYLAGDLEAAYAIVQTRNAGDLKSQGKREALESLAHKQQAAVPRGNAVNSVTSPQTITPQNVDQLVAQNNLEWFMKNREAINKAMAG